MSLNCFRDWGIPDKWSPGKLFSCYILVHTNRILNSTNVLSSATMIVFKNHCSTSADILRNKFSIRYKFCICLCVRVMCHLMMGLRSEKCVVRPFCCYCCCENIVKCTYTHLDGTAYYMPGLYGIAFCSSTTSLYSMSLYKMTQD